MRFSNIYTVGISYGKNKHNHYRGKGCMDKFCKYLKKRRKSKVKTGIINYQKKKKNDIIQKKNLNHMFIKKNVTFSKKNYTGKYRSAAHTILDKISVDFFTF